MKERVLSILVERGLIDEVYSRKRTSKQAHAAGKTAHHRHQLIKQMKQKTGELFQKSKPSHSARKNLKNSHRSRHLRIATRGALGVRPRKAKRLIKKALGRYGL